MAATVKLKAPPVTKSGIKGSVDGGTGVITLSQTDFDLRFEVGWEKRVLLPLAGPWCYGEHGKAVIRSGKTPP